MSNKRKFAKALAIIAGVIVGVVLLCSVVAHIIINHHGTMLTGRQMHASTVYLNPLTGMLRATNLTIKEADSERDFISTGSLYVRINLLALAKEKVSISHLHFKTLNLNLENTSSGLNLMSFLDYYSSSDTTSDSSSSWIISLRDIELKRSNIHYLDTKTQKQWTFDDINIRVPEVALGGEHKGAGIELALPNNGGVLAVNAHLYEQTNRFALNIHTKELHTERALPLIQQFLNIRDIDATANIHLDANGYLDDILGTNIKGEIDIADLNLTDSHRQKIANCKQAKLSIRDLSLKNSQVDLEQLTVDSLTLNLFRTKSSNTLSDLFYESEETQPGAEEPTTDNTADDATDVNNLFSSRPRLRISKLNIRSTSINYRDRTLPSDFKYLISGLTATATDIDSRSSSNNIVVNATLPHGGSMMLSWRGALSLTNSNARIVAMMRNLQLSDLSPWSEQLFGYPLEGGTMSVTSDNSIIHGQLDGTEKLELYKAKVGKRLKRHEPQAGKVPLKAGIGLLENTSGQVELVVPVTGDIDSPSFQLSDVIGKAIGGVLLQATAAPFVAMAKASNRQDDLTFIAIDILKPDFSLDQYQKLDLIAEMMHENEDISLTLTQEFQFEQAISERAIFNLKKEYYESNNKKLGQLTLLDIENIIAIKTNSQEFQNFCRQTLDSKNQLEKRAVEYYGRANLEAEVRKAAADRDKFVLKYLTDQKDLSKKRITVTTLPLDELSTYKGKSQYAVVSALAEE